MNNRKPCRQTRNIPAFLQHELDDHAARDFQQHLSTCAICSDELREFQSIIELLQQDPDRLLSRDLAPVVLEQIEGTPAAPHRFPIPLLRIAALAAGLLGAGLLTWRYYEQPQDVAQINIAQATGSPMERAVNWLSRTQEADGHWDSARWGAQKMYEPGITALALLAMMKESPNGETTALRPALEKGLDYLMTRQGPDGRIGTVCSGTPYNQGMATLALLEACGRQSGSRWQASADRALTYILTTQLPSGGWGYPRETADQGNTSITVWQLQALLRAEELGRADVRPHIEKALAWMSSVTDPEGRIGYSRVREFPNGYETLTAAGAFCLLKAAPDAKTRSPALFDSVHQAARQTRTLDFYRYYFLTRALHTEDTAQSRQLAAALQLKLAASQNLQGENHGSWEPVDRWSSAGGRIYTTAMAVLSLE